jgi:phenylacetate-CoA ligase
MGRVVVTTLYNFGQPIIRYDLGDLAVWGADTCACGRTLKVIDRVVGRSTNLFRFPDGTTVAPFVSQPLAEALGARYVQIAQVQPLEIEVRYVPEEGRSRDHEAAAAIVRRITHPEAIIRVRSQPDLVRTDGGKFMEAVSELRTTS